MSTLQRTAAIREIVPLLFVDNIEKSVAFYCDSLGFTMTSSWRPDDKLAWCRLERGGSAIMLQQACDEDGPPSGRGRGVEFFFLCDDADVIYREFREGGLPVEPPKVAFYAMNQVFVKDPDGYALCFQNAVRE
jgi:uncharacterized glyoxalase superfamily protein PhnB